MSGIEIGETAGRIWQHLAKSGPTVIKDISKSVGVDRELALMALGWLAREEKVKFETKGKDVVVSLTDGELKHIRS